MLLERGPQKGPGAADVEYPDQHANEMAAHCALVTIVSYFALSEPAPVGDGQGRGGPP
jgi:hypothetical protein